MFQDIEIVGWRQFEAVRLDFHPRLTILTGSNGTGKTTVLNLLSRHVGWSLPVVSTPQSSRRGIARFVSDYWRRISRPFAEDELRGQLRIGHITYSSGKRADLFVPEDVQESYQVTIRDQQPVGGLFVSSHRPIHIYDKVTEIPPQIDAGAQLFEQYLNDLRNRYQPRSSVRPPGNQIKRALISLAAFGYGNEAIPRDQDAIQTFEGFQRTLTKILPPSLGFQKFEIRPPEVVLIVVIFLKAHLCLE